MDIPNDFPNPLVIDAYYHPAVDDSKQKFMWGQPQLDSLRIFLMEAFGWPEEKADQVLLPVLREMNKKAVSQSSCVYCVILTYIRLPANKLLLDLTLTQPTVCHRIQEEPHKPSTLVREFKVSLITGEVRKKQKQII